MTRHNARRSGRSQRLVIAALLSTLALACSDNTPDDKSERTATTRADTTTAVPSMCSSGASSPPPTELPDRPNFVFVMVDDLDELVSPYWDALPQTQRLMNGQCTRFENAFATNPLCCPSRASILTGNYPHTTGVMDNSPPDGGAKTFVGPAEDDTLATRLQAAGYDTGFFGKYLNGYERTIERIPPGWNEWFGLGDGLYQGYSYVANHNGEQLTFGDKPADYLTDVLAEQATNYITSREADDDKPFLAFVWPTAPHKPLPPAPRDRDNEYRDDAIPSRPNIDEDDVSDKPTWLREGWSKLSKSLKATLRDDYRDRMGSLLAVDDMVDKIGNALAAGDELDRTIFIFASDNGYSFGAHRVPGKIIPYEESIRIPFVISGPGVTQHSTDAFALNIDIAPTLLDLAGLPHDDVDGRSLVPLLRDPAPPPNWRTDFLVEFNGTYRGNDGPGGPLVTLDDVTAQIAAGKLSSPPTYRGVRSTQDLYVQWYGGDRHEYELYDLDQDADQLENLVATPDGARDHAATTAPLQARLEHLEVCDGPSCRN